MIIKERRRQIKLWLIVSITVLFFTIGTGSYRNSSANSEETYKGLKLFSDVLEIIEKNYVDPIDSKDLIQKAAQGMINSLDPHSQLLPPEAFEELQADTKGEFGGIGIVITMEKGVLMVVSPIEGTPAYKAGIKAKDIIVKIDKDSTKDMMLWEAVRKMRGQKGSKVLITIFRQGLSEPIEFPLVRDIIPLESVRQASIKPGFGYVWVTNFRDNTSDDLEKALDDLKKKNGSLKGLILDLRNNPGGLLNEAIKVSDLFIEKGTIVSIKGRHKKNTQIFSAHTDKIKYSYPIVVLINGGSASAAEIVAGALQDNKRALILGTASFGKGSVQTVEPLRDGYGLKYTIARYYTPSGRSIQAQGIVPDLPVEEGFSDEENSKSDTTFLLKEKDLKNHLDAFPTTKEDKNPKSDNKSDDQKKEKDEKKNLKSPLYEYRHGKITPEQLLSDRQVKRAFEMLTGYDIFKSLHS